MLTSTKRAPRYVVPANHKSFRDLAKSQIVANTMDDIGLKLPPTDVNLADIRREFHPAEAEEQKPERREWAGQSKFGRRHG